jgi:hypothetical protein
MMVERLHHGADFFRWKWLILKACREFVTRQGGAQARRAGVEDLRILVWRCCGRKKSDKVRVYFNLDLRKDLPAREQCVLVSNPLASDWQSRWEV